MKHFSRTMNGLLILLASAMADVGGPVLQIPATLYPRQTAALFDMRPPSVPSSPTSLVVAGILLAAGVFFAGRFFWNRRKKDSGQRSGRPILGLAIGSLLMLGAGTLQNATADKRSELNTAVAEGQMLERTVAVQVHDDISEVALYLVPAHRPTWHPRSK